MSTQEKSQQVAAAVFNEWARRYAENPNEFAAILKPDGTPFEDYGEMAADYYKKLWDEMVNPDTEELK